MGYWQLKLQELERGGSYNRNNDYHREVAEAARQEIAAAHLPVQHPAQESAYAQIQRHAMEGMMATERLRREGRLRG